MILIADSGSTKTDWLLVHHTNNTLVTTSGINAYYMSSEMILGMLRKELQPLVPSNQVVKIYFYGSGCSTESKCYKISSILKELFVNATIEVNHDMLAAARSLCKDETGIASILGTGSNSCVYDGKKITQQMVSLGYFFGDEGSGTHLGKLLITDYLRGEMPAELSAKLNTEFNLSLELVLDNIYNQGPPNKFLASFAPFIQKNAQDLYVRQLVAKSFIEFLKVGIMKFSGFENLKVSFVGSIAFHFQDILKEVALANGIKIEKIQKSVIEGLRDYHLSRHTSAKL